MERWQNQEEAYQFAIQHPNVMLDMDMGCGKTRTALDVVMSREDVHSILVVCPKAVIPVWRGNIEKFYPGREDISVWDTIKGSVCEKAVSIREFVNGKEPGRKIFVVVNYDIVWRNPMGDVLLNSKFDMVVLDESHRAKAAGSKVSKYLAMLGKRTKYKMCLSGTPMANSPLDVYGQYRFLDPTIFGTNHNQFLQQYAILGGPDRRFVVGYKNQKDLNDKFHSIAYSCKMSDISDRLKLPEKLPPVTRYVELSPQDKRMSKALSREFVAECQSGHIVVNNVLTKMLRLQQIAAGFCVTVDGPGGTPQEVELNTYKREELTDLLTDISPSDSVVVFCVFQHDLDTVAKSAHKAGKNVFELSGRRNELEDWNAVGGVLAVQIQAGAEGVDMTKANYAVYYSLPKSLALYNQSMARLYRPGQTRPVSFIHIVARGTIDEAMYSALERKKDIVESIKDGSFDYGFVK